VVRSDGGRAAPRGWCALLLSFYGLTLLQPFRTTPAVARGHGFPSLSKEGSLLRPLSSVSGWTDDWCTT
jgi:hypothetical protein